MRVHFDAATRIQMALVRGNLHDARSAAEDIWAAERVPDLGPEAIPYIREVQDRARDVRDAFIYGEAAQATGRLAAACGTCHARFDGGPRLDYAGGPPEGSGLARHVVRHVWAADRMWEGLLGPSDDAWRLGADLLANDELGGDLLSATAARHAARLNDLAAEALDTTGQDERGVQYGRILSTCGACHAEAPGDR
jgi:cytochrome c553